MVFTITIFFRYFWFMAMFRIIQWWTVTIDQGHLVFTCVYLVGKIPFDLCDFYNLIFDGFTILFCWQIFPCVLPVVLSAKFNFTTVDLTVSIKLYLDRFRTSACVVIVVLPDLFDFKLSCRWLIAIDQIVAIDLCLVVFDWFFGNSIIDLLT